MKHCSILFFVFSVLFVVGFYGCGGDDAISEQDHQKEQSARIEKYKFLTMWNSKIWENWLSDPTDIAADNSGNIYVTSTELKKIMKFSSDCAFLEEWGFEAGFLSFLEGEDVKFGGFRRPMGITVDGLGNVYVADAGYKSDESDGSVKKFTSDGVFLTKWDIPCESVGVDRIGNMYVIGTGKYVQKFSPSGNLLKEWEPEGFSNPLTMISARVSLSGLPKSLAVDRSGNVYVIVKADGEYPFRGDQCVQKFTSEGVLLARWESYIENEKHGIEGVYDITTDSSGNVYIAGLSGFCKYSQDGVYLGGFNGSYDVSSDGMFPGEFEFICCIAADDSQNVFIVDNIIESNGLERGRIQKFGR